MGRRRNWYPFRILNIYAILFASVALSAGHSVTVIAIARYLYGKQAERIRQLEKAVLERGFTNAVRVRRLQRSGQFPHSHVHRN